MKRKIVNPLIAFENKWVALSLDRRRVLVSGATVKEVDSKLKRLRVKNGDAILTRVLPFNKVYSP